MEKSLIIISDDEDECEDLGDLGDYNFENDLKDDFSDPFSMLDFLDHHSSQQSCHETEQASLGQNEKIIEVDDSSQEKEEEKEEEEEEKEEEDEAFEDLGNLEDYLQNQISNETDNHDTDNNNNNNNTQSNSEASSSRSNLPPPDYSLLTIRELQASIARYGFKNLKSRELMVSILEKIRTSERLEKPKVSAKEDGDKNEERMIIQHIKSQENIWKKILRYETVNIDEVYEGLTCKKNKVKAVLDQFAALKKPHRHRGGNLDIDAI